MGKNISDIMRRAELAQNGKGARQPDKPRGFREGLQQDYSSVLGGNGFSRRQPAHEGRRISMEGQLALLTKIKDLKSHTKPEERTLMDFVKLLDALGAFENGRWNDVHIKQSRRDTVDLSVPLSIGVLEGEIRKELSGFFSERIRYGSHDFRGNWEYGRYTFIRLTPTEMGGYSDTYNLHARLPMNSSESMAAKVFLDCKKYGITPSEVGTLAGFIKMVHAGGWASKENTVELFSNRKTNRAVFCISDLLFEESDYRKSDRVNAAVGFFSSRYGKGAENAQAAGEKWWWVVEEAGRVKVGIKAPRIKDFGGLEGRKLFVHVDLSAIGAMDEYRKAASFISTISDQYVLKNDPKKRTVNGFLEMLRSPRSYNNEPILTDAQLAKMAMTYKDGVLVVKGECSSEYAMKEQGPYFAERFRKSRPTDEERRLRRDNEYTYGLMEGDWTHDAKQGKSVPACFLKTDTDYEHPSESRSFRDIFTLQLTGVSVEEYIEAKQFQRALSGGTAENTVADFVETAMVTGLIPGREFLETKYDGSKLTLRMLCDSWPGSGYNLTRLRSFFSERFGDHPDIRHGFDSDSAWATVWEGNPSPDGKRQSHLKLDGYEEKGDTRYLKYELVLGGIKQSEANELNAYLDSMKGKA